MRITICTLLTASALFAGGIHAAEPSTAAQTRATLYQSEIRSALTQHGWSITQDDPGKLTAQRLRIQSGPTGIVAGADSFARLQIDFRADDTHHTVAAAKASLVIEPRDSLEAGRLVYPPLALRDPKLTQEYHEILSAAETRLASHHPAYAGVNPSVSGATGSAARVAMK